MNLNGKIAWVTGGAKRLGRAIALDLARRGADIALHYNTSREEAETAGAEIEALGRRCVLVQGDLAKVAEIERIVAEIEAAFGRLDILINSASTFPRTPLETIDEAAWDAALNVNLKGPAFCALRAAALMRRTAGGGKIINMADSAALRPYRNFLPYMVAKGGIVTLTQGLALELAPAISVNAIAPGLVLPPPETTEAQLAHMLRNIPLGRPGGPEDIVAAVAFLVEGTDYVTGQVIVVDGGRLNATPQREGG